MGVISRAGVVMALFLVVTFLLYTMLLGAEGLRAQENTMMGEMTGGTTAQPDEECENAQEIDSFEGSPGEDMPRSESFQVEGNRFRVSFDAVGTGFASAFITVNDEDEEFEEDSLDSFAADSEDEQNSLIVNAGPGSFFVEVNANGDAGYIVTVEDCGGNDNDDNGDGGNNGNDNDGADDDGDADNDGVIDDTVPDKDLPDTGGFSLIVAGGVALFSAFGILAAWRSRER